MIDSPAFRQVRRYVRDYKIRSGLTTLGILVGVATVVVFVILGAGLQASVLSTVAGDNADLVYVGTSQERTAGPPVVGKSSTPVFSSDDVVALSEVDGVSESVPLGRSSVGVEIPGEGVRSIQLHATSPSYFGTVRSEAFADGEVFEAGSDEIVLNRQAAAALETSLGDELTVHTSNGEIAATVAGIVENQLSVTEQVTGDPPRPAIYASPDPFYTRTVSVAGSDEPQRAYAWVFLVAESDADSSDVRDSVAEFLAGNADVQDRLPDDRTVSVTSREDWKRHVGDLTDTFTGYLLTVSVVSLLVGAIGIANVMLVSVTQRIREVGVMRAMGARRRDVLELFLLEAALLGVLGSALGAVTGLGVAWLATDLLDIPYVVDPTLLAAAIGVGIATSLLAGAYPAWLASRLDPVEAIRRE